MKAKYIYERIRCENQNTHLGRWGVKVKSTGIPVGWVSVMQEELKTSMTNNICLYYSNILLHVI